MNASPSLLEGDVGGHIRRLSLPLAWGMLALTSFTVADTFFISKLGTRELAALGFCIPVVMFFMGVIFGLSIATTSVVARQHGTGDREKVRRISTDAMTISTLIILAVSVIGYLTAEPIFRLIGADADLMPMIRQYMALWYVALPFLSAMIVGNSCMRGLGETKYVSHIMTALAVSNIVLDPLFIFGWGPFPHFGFAGAALAHVVACFAVCMFSYYHLIFRFEVVAKGSLVHPGLRDSFKRLMHVALPAILSNQIAPVSAAVITWMASSFGQEAVAALGVASRIDRVSTIIFFSTGTGVAIFAGQNHGAGKFERIREAMEKAGRSAMVWGVFFFAFFWIFAEELALIFDKNPDVVAYTKLYLLWVPVSYGAMGVMILANAVLNAVGRPAPATALVLLRTIVIYIPLAFLLREYFGFTGILIALMVTNFAVGAISYFWNKRIADVAQRDHEAAAAA